MATPSVKRKARYTINNALRSGLINRPEKCSVCGIYPGRGKDGRSLIQFHHYSYARKPFGAFLCAQCHRHEHL
jgi:hypothetical protein